MATIEASIEASISDAIDRAIGDAIDDHVAALEQTYDEILARKEAGEELTDDELDLLEDVEEIDDRDQFWREYRFPDLLDQVERALADLILDIPNFEDYDDTLDTYGLYDEALEVSRGDNRFHVVSAILPPCDEGEDYLKGVVDGGGNILYQTNHGHTYCAPGAYVTVKSVDDLTGDLADTAASVIIRGYEDCVSEHRATLSRLYDEALEYARDGLLAEVVDIEELPDVDTLIRKTIDLWSDGRGDVNPADVEVIDHRLSNAIDDFQELIDERRAELIA